MKEVIRQTPFKERLTPFSNSETLFTLSDNSGKKNYIVRKEAVETKKGYPLYEIEIMSMLLKNFQEDFKISVVPFSIIVGLNEENQISAFIIAERIHGKCLNEANIEEKEAKRFFSSLLEYHIDIFENGGFLIDDLNSDDFSYGHTSKDPVDRIYFTDLDPFYEHISGFSPQDRKESYVSNLESLNSILLCLEKKDADYGELRKKFIDFLKRIKGSFHPDDREVIGYIIKHNQELITEGAKED